MWMRDARISCFICAEQWDAAIAACTLKHHLRGEIGFFPWGQRESVAATKAASSYASS